MPVVLILSSPKYSYWFKRNDKWAKSSLYVEEEYQANVVKSFNTLHFAVGH